MKGEAYSNECPKVRFVVNEMCQVLDCCLVVGAILSVTHEIVLLGVGRRKVRPISRFEQDICEGGKGGGKGGGVRSDVGGEGA